MGLFGGQSAEVIEWQEYRDDLIFWKWTNREIKKGSRLYIQSGQDAVFLFNGHVEGIFTDEGSYDIETAILPYLSSLKGFKFGFRSGLRAEVLFVNTKEFTIRWGTKNAIHLPSELVPGGIPVRAFGSFNCKVRDYMVLIDKIAGIRQEYTVEDVQARVLPLVDQLLMKWMMKEGKDLLNLQANSAEIGRGIQEDLDYELFKIGLTVTGFHIQNVSYPEEVQRIAARAAAEAMFSVKDAAGKTERTAADDGDLIGARFCPNCGTKLSGARFCPNCGLKIK